MRSGTIFALASGSGPAGVAVIRVSGPRAADSLRQLGGPRRPLPRRLVRVSLSEPTTGEALDDGLAAWFPAPASFTGEDVVEFHVHGGRSVVDGLLGVLGACEGLRLAEPGEFTRRAFENGKLDLTAAEGLADLVAAETAGQRRQALRQLRGELGRLYESWRERLVSGLAHLEATIDFSDEDIPDRLVQGVRAEAADLVAEIAVHLGDDRRGERLRDGVHLVLVGPPNAGKSSLLNMLARRDAAIVSEMAGTTRDVIEVHLDLGGFPLVAADTAGLRDGADGVEGEGVRRATRRAREADLRLAVLDVQAWPEVDARTRALIDDATLVVVNKVDLARPRRPLEVNGRPVYPISIRTGDGIDALMVALEGAVADRCAGTGGVAATRARHREALEECRDALGRFLDAEAPELAAEDLRLAARSLGRITGRVGVEDMLDVIFRDFCIGK